MTPERNLIEAVPHRYHVIRLSPDPVDFILAGSAVQTALAEVRAKPEPVLRWEGDSLMLGGEEVGFALPESDELFFWRSNLAARVGKCPTLTEARTAAEQAVRDWLKRAGVVAQVREEGVRAGIEAAARDEIDWYRLLGKIRKEWGASAPAMARGIVAALRALDAAAIAKGITTAEALSELAAADADLLDLPDTLADSDGDDGA